MVAEAVLAMDRRQVAAVRAAQVLQTLVAAGVGVLAAVALSSSDIPALVPLLPGAQLILVVDL